MNETDCYIAIDLKSFYASVECVERGLDPLDACLVVADISRTQKTICLAVSAPLKEYGTGGRPRLFEVVAKVREVNRQRGHKGQSFSKAVLDANLELAVDYIVAPPRMATYIRYSTRIYSIYLRYFAPEDIHVYSIDEVIIYVTPYLRSYRMAPRDIAGKVIRDILSETGITATAGIGTNMYLCKIAMDIVAKKMKPDERGVSIAELDEMAYRRHLWNHTPLTDFWQVGAGIAARLAPYELQTMGDIARCSVNNEELLYSILGINAELLIDHAWGWEPVTIRDVKAYCPGTTSISSSQVLPRPYTISSARTVILEMADNLALALFSRKMIAGRLVVEISYAPSSLTDPARSIAYKGRVVRDMYGRPVPANSHATFRFQTPTSSARLFIEKAGEIFDRIACPPLLVRRLMVTARNVVGESSCCSLPVPVQLTLFTDYEELRSQKTREEADLQRERRCQEAILRIKSRFGRNAILKGLNFAEGATQRQRNCHIGGHHE